MVRPRLAYLAAWTSEITLTILFFLIPLFFWSATSELFEFNKIILLYLAAAVLLSSETIRVLNLRQPEVIRPKLLIAGLIFLAALGLATVFSIDPHVSLFGYFDRWQGGFLSWIAAGITYVALTQQPKDSLLSLLKVSLAAGLIVSVWGIAEHLGHSPSCFLLTHRFDASCWVENVQSRVFATLGQPNWMAAYLAMLLPWGLALFLTAGKLARFIWFGLLVVTYLGFLFTYSRGGSIGLGIAIVLFLGLLGWRRLLTFRWRLLALAITLAVATLVFATPLTKNLFGSPPARGIGTSVELGNDSGPTRLVVWQGAWEIFNYHPLLGTGVETYGESFYNYRPLAMNGTSEWDFLFNKAHNEFLNYLATTGLVGTLAYLFLLGSFFYYGLVKLRRDPGNFFWIIASLASVAGYLGQNVFSFTVVPLATLFVFDLAILNLDEQRTLTVKIPRLLSRFRLPHPELVVVIPTIALIITTTNIWRANIAYADGMGSLAVGDNQAAASSLANATQLDPWEPNYMVELAVSLAGEANSTVSDGTARELTASAAAWANRATSISPDNLYLWQRKALALTTLIPFDSTYFRLAESAYKKELILAPTYPKAAAELAQFYRDQNKPDLAKEYFLKAAQLKPDWLDPDVALTEIEIEQGNLTQAKIYLTKARSIAPNDPNVITLSQKVGL